MISIYYGLSGTFKGTTIREKQKNLKNSKVLWSMIKPWKNLENGIFKGMIERNDLNYALLHLCLLEHMVNSETPLIVERGVSDMLYYKTRYTTILDDSFIKKAIDKELEICGELPKKILLIQEDKNFIKDVVLSEPSRKEVFPGGLDDYLWNQEHYIEFTKKYNNISEIVVINNAKEYIENLGLTYDTNIIRTS